MGTIFYLCGKSSTGKDTIYKILLNRKDLELHRMIPYTTRPIRAGEAEGVEYHFVDENKLEEIKQSGKLIELREYNTIHGIWKYFTVCDEDRKPEGTDYLMIGTLESYIQTKKHYGADMVVPILIDLEDGIRLQRALDREKNQDIPQYQEMCRRFLADASDFDEDKIEKSGIKKRFYNEDLNKCIEEIVSYIKLRQHTI